MPKGSEFTAVERGKLIGLREAGWTFVAIAKHIGRSVSGVSKFWRMKAEYGKVKRPGRPTKVSQRTQRRIVQEAKQSGASSSAIKTALGLTISTRSVRRVLQRTPHMGYGKRNRTPMLKAGHILARRKWARAMVIARTDWDQVVFSDEKKFNLDGRDGVDEQLAEAHAHEQHAHAERHEHGAEQVGVVLVEPLVRVLRVLLHEPLLHLGGPAAGHTGAGDAVLERQQPGRDHGRQLAERVERVGVGASRRRDPRDQLHERERVDAAHDTGDDPADERGGARRAADDLARRGEDTAAHRAPHADAQKVEEPEVAWELLRRLLCVDDAERLGAQHVLHEGGLALHLGLGLARG
ncbi:hypothetical protein ON010_g5742 [Phytophthora cinnamomi]|nr:hypothetical protein ON010_g5742 [Phytophthora cinnamomi]